MNKLAYKAMGAVLNVWSLIHSNSAARQAYMVSCRPVPPTIRDKERAFIETARMEQRMVEGYPITEYHWGDPEGPMVLLTYGWSYNVGRWRHFVPALELAGFHVVAYDPPGHGLTEGNFLNLLINSLLQRNLIDRYGPVEAIIGHSFGGASAVYTVSHLPVTQRPKRMVVMASFSSTLKMFGEFRVRMGLWKSTFRRWLQWAERQNGLPLHYFDMARLSGHLSTVQALLVHDPADAVTPFSSAQRYHTFWPGSALWAARGGGHHLGTAAITAGILAFVEHGTLPPVAAVSESTLDAQHDLVRYFAGMEV